jgi:hypothetical protein
MTITRFDAHWALGVGLSGYALRRHVKRETRAVNVTCHYSFAVGGLESRRTGRILSSTQGEAGAYATSVAARFVFDERRTRPASVWSETNSRLVTFGPL